MDEQDCIHGKTLAECDLCEAVKFCLDYPEDAAQELVQLREEVADQIDCATLCRVEAIAFVIGFALGAVIF